MTLNRGLAAVLAVAGVVVSAAACQSSSGAQGAQGSSASSSSVASSSAPSSAAASSAAGSSTSAPPTSHSSSAAAGHNVDICGAFTAADLSKAVGETFLKCEQTMTTDPLTANIHQTVATYSESDDLRIFTISYTTNFAGNLQKRHPDTKVTGLGDAAWYNEPGFDLSVAFGPNVILTRPGMRDMGGGDPLAVDKKVTDAVVGRIGAGG